MQLEVIEEYGISRFPVNAVVLILSNNALELSLYCGREEQYGYLPMNDRFSSYQVWLHLHQGTMENASSESRMLLGVLWNVG